MEMATLEPTNLLGKALEIHLTEGATFYFKVTGCNQNYIDGYDDEGMNLRIEMKDIAFAIDISLKK